MGIAGWAEGSVLVLSAECKIEHCEACFSHNFCTKCREGLYLHKGRCYSACPEGSTASNGTLECSSPGEQLRALGQRDGYGKEPREHGQGCCAGKDP